MYILGKVKCILMTLFSSNDHFYHSILIHYWGQNKTIAKLKQENALEILQCPNKSILMHLIVKYNAQKNVILLIKK